MENKVLVNENVNHPHILVLIPKPDLQQEMDSTIDLLLFLLRYSFLLPDKPQENIFIKRDFSSPGDISTQNSNGARYLDPKYSRWISVDPALGEYVPQAGKGNASDASNLPGMGGIYNSVNGNLYHYAGNNPVKYVDPDGRLDKNSLEYMFVRQVLGDKGVEIFKRTTFLTNPFEGSASLNNGVILLDADYIDNPMSSDEGREHLIHELFHQIQYAENKAAFGKLLYELNLNLQIEEFGLNPTTIYFDHTGGMLYLPDNLTKQKNYTYQYDLSAIETLNDLKYFEAQAELVGDFARYYYSERYSNGIEYQFRKNDMKKMAEILYNSGYDTEAVNWVLERY